MSTRYYRVADPDHDSPDHGKNQLIIELLDQDPDPDLGVRIASTLEKMCAITSSKVTFFHILDFFSQEKNITLSVVQ